jgi:hypothetical protein
MKPARAPSLREARQGDEPDEIHLVADDGAVLIVHAHGLHVDEQLRVREAVLRLLKSVSAR